MRSSNVTVKDLTIDGDAGVGGAGTRNFFGGIVTDYNAGSFSNLQAKNLMVQHLWRVGIYFDGGISALSTGNIVMDNTVTDVAGGLAPPGFSSCKLARTSSTTRSRKSPAMASARTTSTTWPSRPPSTCSRTRSTRSRPA